MNTLSNSEKLVLVDNIFDSIKEVSNYCAQLQEIVNKGKWLVYYMKDEKTRDYYKDNNYPDVSEYEAYYNNLEKEVNELCALEKGIIDMPTYLKNTKIPYIQQVIKTNERLFSNSFSMANNNKYSGLNTLYGNARKERNMRKRSRKTNKKAKKQTRRNK
jgi:hypothetical protein